MIDESEIRKFKYFAKKNLSHLFDPLTKVLNRETMVAYMNHLIKEKVPFCFGLVDIDNFKTVNDSYGHLAGDVVLAKTAEYLLDSLSQVGVVGRYGGDEFMVVIEGVTEYKEIWDIGHNLNMGIGNVTFDGLKGLHITMTMGISRCPDDDNTCEGIFNLADKALYRGKMKGRNCFIIYLEAKHKNIDISKSKGNAQTGMSMSANIFSILTEHPDVESNIIPLFKFLVSNYMFDHICIETKSGFNYQIIYNLAKCKEFQHIDIGEIDAVANNIGVVNIGRIGILDESDYGSLITTLKGQRVSAVLYCKISAFGKDYGYIRVDMTDTVRIWQNNEINLLITTANTIALMLYYQNKTLDNLPQIPAEIISAEIK